MPSHSTKGFLTRTSTPRAHAGDHGSSFPAYLPSKEDRRELRLQGSKRYAQAHTANKRKRQDSNPGLRAPGILIRQSCPTRQGAPAPKQGRGGGGGGARALSVVLNQRGHSPPPAGVAKAPSHLAQEGALISSASFPDSSRLKTKLLKCGLYATLGKKANL